MEKVSGLDTQKISSIGKDFVTRELTMRGSLATQIKGPKNLIKAISQNKARKVSIRVKSRASGDWQIPWTEGREGREPEDETEFWILVDLTVSKTRPIC